MFSGRKLKDYRAGRIYDKKPKHLKVQKTPEDHETNRLKREDRKTRIKTFKKIRRIEVDNKNNRGV